MTGSENPDGERPLSASPTVLATAMLRARRSAREMLGGTAIHDPGWDMLLAVYAAKTDGREVPELELVSAAEVSPTAGKRYIEHLVRQGWLVESKSGGEAAPTYVIGSHVAGAFDSIFAQFDRDVRGDAAGG